ncbi:MAG: hypothetical protein ACLQBA_14405 [Candidatus Binataceae bacterium]
MRVNPASVQALAREVFEYELTDDAAASVARILGAMTNGLRQLEVAGGSQPPFGYPTLEAEARRLRQRASQ